MTGRPTGVHGQLQRVCQRGSTGSVANGEPSADDRGDGEQPGGQLSDYAGPVQSERTNYVFSIINGTLNVGGGADGDGGPAEQGARGDQPGVDGTIQRASRTGTTSRGELTLTHGDGEQPGGQLSDHAEPGGSERQAGQLQGQLRPTAR